MASQSKVFDAFVAAAAADTVRSDPIQRGLQRAEPSEDEREVAIDCLTAAAETWRQVVESEHRAPRVGDGDQAFQEWDMAKPITVDGRHKAIQERFLEAMSLAAAGLGPLLGGGISSAVEPGQRPEISDEEIVPTQAELVEMAQAAGAVVGLASAQLIVDGVKVVLKTGHGRIEAPPEDANT